MDVSTREETLGVVHHGCDHAHTHSGNLTHCTSWVTHTPERKPYMLDIMGVSTPTFQNGNLTLYIPGVSAPILENGNITCHLLQVWGKHILFS